MEKTYKWKTETGKHIVMTTEEHYNREINADFHLVKVADDHIIITKLLVDNKKYPKASLTKYKGKNALYLGTLKNRPIYTFLPQEIYQAVWGDYDKRQAQKLHENISMGIEYIKNGVKNGLCPYCHTYCNGDCRSK